MTITLKNKTILIEKKNFRDLPSGAVEDTTSMMIGKVMNKADDVTIVSQGNFVIVPEMNKNSYPEAKLSKKTVVFVPESNILCVITE